MRKILILTIMILAVFARENPFIPVEKSVVKEFQIAKVEPPEYRPFEWIKFVIEGNSLKIFTKDKIKRAFYIKNLDKIVIDFSSNRSFYTKKIENLKHPLVENIVIGAHKKYYRVAIKLKKRVKYRLNRKDESYEIKLF